MTRQSKGFHFGMELRIVKVVVIGGAGFIGSHVVDKLLSYGHSVRVFDRQPERFRGSLAGVDYRFGDFADKMALVEALSGMDAVYHFVSTTVPGTADLDPKADVKDNLVGCINLLESMQYLGIRRILFLSSGGTVYGIPEKVPIPETHPLRPINSYGIVKVTIEHYLELFRRTRGLSPVVVRASNPFGPRQSHSGVQGVISTYLRNILVRQPIEIWGDGSVIRDYFEVGDLAELCVRAGTSSAERAYNAGSGYGLSINEIVEAIREVTGSNFETVHKPGRPIDVPCSVLDCTRAKEDFGWECKTEFKTGLRQTWAWLTSNAPSLDA
ncbi:MAG TPA: NAD-dependent epimerase/dehydratase family protein [Candidatus Binataceae bacterium]|nr:NAD-dependent epimerase/dehydratase family protein [Candidatus Binataceae bacterium]